MNEEIAKKAEQAVWAAKSLFERGKTAGSTANLSFRHEGCIYISGSGTFNAPEMDITTVEIPGRNGDLTISNNRFRNITVEYPAFIRKQFRHNAAAAKL